MIHTIFISMNPWESSEDKTNPQSSRQGRAGGGEDAQKSKIHIKDAKN
jgi:hypothetical protein